MTTLDDAVAYWLVSEYSGSGDLADQSASHDAQLGSGAGADSNDPLFLNRDGFSYVYLPGIAGNKITTPDNAALGITSDIDVRARIYMDDVDVGSVVGDIACKRSDQNEWRFGVKENGQLDAAFWNSSGGLTFNTSGSDLNAYDGQWIWVRVTYEPSQNPRLTKFWYSTDDTMDHTAVSWSQLGATDSNAGSTNIKNAGSDLEIGFFGSAEPLYANVARVVVLDGVDGTAAVDFHPDIDATEPLTTMTSSVTGEVWTFNRAASGRKLAVVDKPLFLFGTDDYLEVADHADLDFAADASLSVLVACRLYGTTGNQALLAKKADLTTAAGYSLDRGTANAPRFMVADGSADDDDVAGAITQGVTTVVGGVRNVADDDIEAFTAGSGSGSPTTDSTTATLANAHTLRIGRLSSTGSNYADMEFLGAAVFDVALTDAEVASIGDELLGIEAAVSTTTTSGAASLVDEFSPQQLLKKTGIVTLRFAWGASHLVLLQQSRFESHPGNVKIVANDVVPLQVETYPKRKRLRSSGESAFGLQGVTRKSNVATCEELRLREQDELRTIRLLEELM